MYVILNLFRGKHITCFPYPTLSDLSWRHRGRCCSPAPEDLRKILPLLGQKCSWCHAAAGCGRTQGSLGCLGPQHLVPQMPARVGSHSLVGFLLLPLQSLAVPRNPSPLPCLLPFFLALHHLCFPLKLSLTCCLSFSPLSLQDLKSINPANPAPAHLRAGNTRSYPSSPRKTRPLPSAPQRAVNTSKSHSLSPWGLSSRMPRALWFVSEMDLFCISLLLLVWCLMKTPTAKWNFSHFDSQLCKFF